MSLPSTAANKPVVLGKVGICLLNIVSYFAVLALYQSSLGPCFVVGKRVKARRAKQTEWWIREGKRAVEPSPDYHSASPLRFFFITSPPPSYCRVGPRLYQSDIYTLLLQDWL